jgi:hypothetical protein
VNKENHQISALSGLSVRDIEVFASGLSIAFIVTILRQLIRLTLFGELQ